MNLCLECGKRTKNPKYCSRSCSASANNRGNRRHGRRDNYNCLKCGTNIVGKGKKYCSHVCQQSFQRQYKVKNGAAGIVSMKNFLIETSGHQCQMCKNKEWNSEPIPIEIDHKDGNHKNNSLENLRLLCPNCHALTPTYKNKNKGKGRAKRMDRYRARRES